MTISAKRPGRGEETDAGTGRGRGARVLSWCDRNVSKAPYQWAAAALGFIGAVVAGIGALVVGPLPPNRPQQWWFSVPSSWSDTHAGEVTMTVLCYLGIAMVVVAWLVIGFGVRGGRWRIRSLWLLAAVWALPWVVAPVALTTDIYTYLGQGLVANAGLNPYVQGPGAVALPDVLHTRIAPPVWNVPSPYGPIFLGVGKLLAPMAAEHIFRAILLLRLVEIVGLVLTAVSLPRVARAAGANPVIATWMGVASPLVLASGILSGHNDLLMIGLVMAALAIATFDHAAAMPAAIAVCTLAALVKSPAAVGVAVLTVTWVWSSGRVREGAARLIGAGAIVAALSAVASVAVGLGTQWLNIAAVRSPATLAQLFTPVKSVSYTIHSMGIGASTDAVSHVVDPIATVLAGLFALAVLWRHHRVGAPRAVGMIFAAVLLASPVVWPWYLIWPVIMLAATRQGRGRFVWIALSAVALFVVQPDGSAQPFGGPLVWLVAVLTIVAFVRGVRYAHRVLIAEPDRATTSSRVAV